MQLPDLSQLLSLSSPSNGFAGLFGAQTSGQVSSLFGGLTGEGVSAEGGLFGNVLSSVLGESGLMETLAAAEAEGLEDLENLENAEEAELAILQVTQIVTVVYEEFSLLSSSGAKFDDLNSVDALSAAYQELGMAKEEADSRATRLTVMFMLLDNRISTADLIAGIGGDQIAVKQQRAFIQIEQTIQAFSVASIGSSSQLSALLEEGKGLLNGGLTDADLQAALAGAGLQTDADLSLGSGKEIEGNLFGRVSEIFSKLADRASQHPEGKQLAAQLQEIAQATQNIADKVVKEGGLSNLQKALETPTLQSNSQQALSAEIAEEQALPAAAKAERDAQANARAQEQAADEANLGRVAADRASDASRNNAAQLNNSRPQALSEPPIPTFVVRPSADGGVEVIDPQTGEVVQSGQGSPSTASNAQVADGAMAQSRGLETAQQARLAQQVRVHVRTLAGHNGGQIVVNLNPKELGRVQVRLEIEDGLVRGAITVQRPDVAESIAKDMRALEQALQDVGLKLAQEGIAIQLENHSAGDSNSKDSEGKNQTGTGFATTSNEALAGAADADETAGQWMNPERLLDVKA